MKSKSYIYLFLISLISIPAFSQQLDEAFLKSLPNNISSDLLDRAAEKKSQEEPQYRRPSTFIEKPDSESDRFGANVFSMMQSSFMPTNEPNFDSSYVLDFGDELELQLVGQKSSITKLYIKRDGSINIKDIGKIFLAGLSLGEAVNLVKNKINESFIGIEAYLSLTNVRDITIIMTGNVYNPGPYTLNGNSNVFHALSVSGGPSEGGSYRSINLIRNNKEIESIDLYDTFIYGKSSFNTRLRTGDIIFIAPVKNIINVSGGVKRPGAYELLEDDKLSLALEFANGLRADADKSNIKLERILDGKIKPIEIINISQFDQIKSADGDRVFIRSYPFRTISISGAVINPGNYLMNEGDNIFDAISKAGGYSINAYPFGAIYENKEAELNASMAQEKLYNNMLDQLLSSSSESQKTSSSINEITLLLAELKNIKPSGRIIADFVNEDDAPLLLKDEDKITIPEITNQVYLYGEISSEGSARYVEGESVSFYINKKGGFTKNSDIKNLYVLQPNGETEKVTFNKNVFNNQADKVKVYRGSVIYIPRKLENNYVNLIRTQAYATILGNLGVSLASLSVLKD